jgi:hypothetical protein
MFFKAKILTLEGLKRICDSNNANVRAEDAVLRQLRAGVLSYQTTPISSSLRALFRDGR